MARQEVSSNATIIAATMAKDAELTATIGKSVASILSGTTIGGKAIESLVTLGGKAWNTAADWVGGFFSSSPATTVDDTIYT
jgi:hypothetical protein